MHKELWDAIIKCRKRKVRGYNKDEWAAYCAGCPLGSECGNYELGEQDTLHHKKGGEIR